LASYGAELPSVVSKKDTIKPLIGSETCSQGYWNRTADTKTTENIAMLLDVDGR